MRSALIESYTFNDVSYISSWDVCQNLMVVLCHSSKDDPFHSELATFIDVVEGRKTRDNILSSYEDAIKTYELVRFIVVGIAATG